MTTARKKPVVTGTYHPLAVLRHYARAAGDAVERADLRTSMSDARIAICLARGVAPDDIDPSSGYDISERAYQSVRASWVWAIKQHGWSPFCRPDRELSDAFDRWQRWRPDLAADDSADAWLADGSAAHHSYWAGSCNRSSCDLHVPAA